MAVKPLSGLTLATNTFECAVEMTYHIFSLVRTAHLWCATPFMTSICKLQLGSWYMAIERQDVEAPVEIRCVAGAGSYSLEGRVISSPDAKV